MPYIRGCRRLVAAVLLPLALLAARPAAALDTEQASQLVRSASADALAAFAGKKMTADEARAAMRPLIAKYGDMMTESHQILGRYWSKASPEDQRQFAGLLERFVISAFGGMIDEVPADQKIQVVGAQAQGDRVVVRALVSSGSEIPTPVDWVVTDTSEGRAVIVDVAIDGVSLVPTLKEDFTSVIRSTTGRLEALFEPLRRKVGAVGS